MADIAKHPTTRWIVALCLTATLAVVGWTSTATMAIRMKALEEVQAQTQELRVTVVANNVRLAVLENKYDTIQATLVEIKVMVQKLQEKH